MESIKRQFMKTVETDDAPLPSNRDHLSGLYFPDPGYLSWMMLEACWPFFLLEYHFLLAVDELFIDIFFPEIC
jgi:hypothetical protein